MTRFKGKIIFLLFVVVQSISCDNGTSPADNGTSPANDINYEIIGPLRDVIAQDLLVFENNSIPQEVIDSLLEYKAIIFGEFHTILEERELIAKLAISLSHSGNQIEICAECPDAYSWIYELVSLGEVENLPEWATYNKMIPIINSVKAYYLRNNKSIEIHCIDANLQLHFFKNSIIPFAEYIGNLKLQYYVNMLINSSPEDYTANLNEFINILGNDPEELDLSINDRFYETILRMAQNELGSIEIRNKWETDYLYAFGKREDLIKSNADYFLSRNSSIIIFYFGSNHAQKERYLGSNIEWLGEYLHYSSQYSKSSAFSIVGLPLKSEIVNSSNTGTFYFDLVLNSKPDDIFRIIGEFNNTQYSYLPLSHSIFINEKIRAKYIYENSEVVIPLKKQFDAFIIIPSGTYVGW